MDNLKRLNDTLESMGFWHNYEEGSQDFEFGQHTPYGEDWFESYTIDDKDNVYEEFMYELKRRIDNWDDDEEVEPFIEIRGQHGVPESISALLDDAGWKFETLEKLKEELEKEPDMILNQYEIDSLSKETKSDLLMVLYKMEDELDYGNIKVGNTINYLQEEV